MRYDLSKVLPLKNFELKCEECKRKGQVVELTVKSRSRSLNQNSLFHVWVKVFADYIGETDLEVCKSMIKNHLLGRKIVQNRFNGQEEMQDFKTRELSNKQMSEFMDKFKAFAMTEYGCYLPYGNEEGYHEMLGEYL